MKKTKRILLLCIIYIGLIAAFSSAKAATASINASKTSVNVGESVTINVSMNAASWNLDVSGATSKKIVGNTEDGENTKKTEQIKFAPSAEGTYTVKLSGDVSDGSTNATTNVSGSVTITVAKSTSNSDSKTNNSTTNTTPTTPNEPTFKSTKDTVYATGSINIRKSYSADSDAIGKLAVGESATRTGIGDNGWSKVTYNGVTGYVKTNLITTQEPKKSSDKSLKTLEVSPEGIDS